VDAVWLPFELHPEVPPEGMARSAYFPPGRLRQMDDRLQAMAAEAGLTMRRRGRMVNSRLALAAAEFARERQAFDPVHRALFRVHWEGPGELDDVEELKRVVREAGLDEADLETALADGRYDKLLDAAREEALSVGINAVPAHVFGRRFLLVGAQPDEIYRQVLSRLAELPAER
jgi:predicted DsbA family dithiol-disulfide isomerase